MKRLQVSSMGSFVVAAIVGAALVGRLAGQELSTPGADAGLTGSANVLVPQLARCVWTPHHSAVTPAGAAPGAVARPGIHMTEVVAKIDIVEQVATTALDIGIENGSSRPEEVVLLIPVPAGAAVRGFEFDGTAKEPTAKLLPAAEAARIYHGIVAKSRDPGLLEFAGMATVRSSVFPVPAGGKRRVRLTYETLCPKDGNRVDFALPRSQLAPTTAVPWKIELRIASKAAISTVYSPSHPIDTDRRGAGELVVKLVSGQTLDPGPFLLSYLLDSGEVSASLLAYPDSTGKGGYFLMLAGLPARLERRAASAATDVKREVILVLDRSGSMAGEKIEQAKAAAAQIVGSLADGEAFNIIDFSDSVERFAAAPVVKDSKSAARARDYIAAIQSNGGTALHDALVEALRQPHEAGRLPIVLFLTDGLPTVGERSELAIRRAAETMNAAGRRIFTIGVGHDVNVPLLSKIAQESRAAETFIQPGENVEVKVSAMFRKLRGPVLVGTKLVLAADVADDPDGKLTRIRDVQPAKLPDLFEGDQLVVLGRYVGTAPLELALSGSFRDRERTFRFKFDTNKASTRNAFVGRLWASRRIAWLVDEVRQRGAELGLVGSTGFSAASLSSSSRPPAASAAIPPGSSSALLANAAMKELVEEIVRLSKEFGVLTEYTAFLAEEGTDLAKLGATVPGLAGLSSKSTRQQLEVFICASDLDRGAVQNRSGAWAVSQGLNNVAQRTVGCQSSLNRWFDASMNAVSTASVQQLDDLNFFRRAGRWTDSRLLDAEITRPDDTIEVGTPAYAQLAERLTATGRNSLLGMPGDILVRVDGKTILVKAASEKHE